MEKSNNEHYAKVEWPDASYSIMFGDSELAKSDRVLKLLEFHGNYNIGPVFYFPNDSIAMEYFEKSETKTHCPLKGEASYFNLVQGERVVKDTLWTYENPLNGVAEIKGFSAFFLKKGFELLEN